MKTLSHIPEIDGLRALAVLGVFLFHVDYLSGGFLGVEEGATTVTIVEKVKA